MPLASLLPQKCLSGIRCRDGTPPHSAQRKWHAGPHGLPPPTPTSRTRPYRPKEAFANAQTSAPLSDLAMLPRLALALGLLALAAPTWAAEPALTPEQVTCVRFDAVGFCRPPAHRHPPASPPCMIACSLVAHPGSHAAGGGPGGCLAGGERHEALWHGVRCATEGGG